MAAKFRAPMAIAVIGGVISSTLLSLIVLPVFYLTIENIKGFISRRRRGVRTGERSVRPAPAAVSQPGAALTAGVSAVLSKTV